MGTSLVATGSRHKGSAHNALTGATERDIDMIFGWNEHMYRAIMQLHYESNLQRDKRAKVTSLM